LGASITVVGFLALIRSTFNLLFQFPGGILADKYGRRKVIIYGSSLRILSPIIYLFAKTWQHLIPGMIIESIASIYMPAFNATIAESLPTDRRGAGYGAYRMIISSPMVFVPVISGIFFDRVGLVNGMMIGFRFSIIVSIVMVIIRAKFIKETLKPKVIGDRLSNQLSFKESVSALSIIRGSLLAMMIVSIISQFAMQMTMPFITIYVIDVKGFSMTAWGLVGTVTGIISLVLTLPGGMLADRYGRRIPIIIGRLLGPVNMLGLIYLQNINQLLTLYIITGLCSAFGGGGAAGIYGGMGAMGGPAWQALTADLIPSADRGKVSGLLATITGMTGLLAPYFGGYLWETIGPNPLLIGTIPIGLSALFIFTIFVKEPKEKAV
jgi:MFS family permease